MNVNDKKIIENIKEFLKMNKEPTIDNIIEEKFQVDAYVARLFGIPKTTFSQNKNKYKEQHCDVGILTVYRISNFFDNAILEFGNASISEYAAYILKNEDSKDLYEKKKNQ
jgi:hypothetical protein